MTIDGAGRGRPHFSAGGTPSAIDREVRRATELVSGGFWRDGDRLTVCVDLPKGASELTIA
jgi:hypothetical protein